MFVYTSGPAGFIAALYDQLEFGRIIDELVPWDPTQCLLSPGARVKAMVINIFCGRTLPYKRVLYRHGYGKPFRQGDNPDDLVITTWPGA